MAWHLVDYARECHTSYCKSAAKVALRNSRNDVYGYYCRRCGAAEVRSRNKKEEHQLRQPERPQG